MEKKREEGRKSEKNGEGKRRVRRCGSLNLPDFVFRRFSSFCSVFYFLVVFFKRFSAFYSAFHYFSFSQNALLLLFCSLSSFSFFKKLASFSSASHSLFCLFKGPSAFCSALCFLFLFKSPLLFVLPLSLLFLIFIFEATGLIFLNRKSPCLFLRHSCLFSCLLNNFFFFYVPFPAPLSAFYAFLFPSFLFFLCFLLLVFNATAGIPLCKIH